LTWETLNALPKTIQQEIKIRGVRSEENIRVEKRFYMDFNNKTARLAFYVPDTNHTLEICLQLLNEHEATIRDFVQQFQGKIEVGPIGGRQTEVKDLKFTGFIVFYHESFMNQSELDWLTSKAQKKGLSVEFRSQQYVLAHWR
jgi:hypothetical protein